MVINQLMGAVAGPRRHVRAIPMFLQYKNGYNLSRTISLSSLLIIRCSSQGKALVGTSVPSLFLLSCLQVVLTTRSPHSLFLHPLHSRLRGSFFIIVNMPPYKSLAIVALAASSVSPALSAPTRYVNVCPRVRGPPDGPIPLDRVRSSLEANVKNERTRSYWSVSRLILPCARYRPFLSDRLAAAQNTRPRLPRVGQLPSWRGAGAGTDSFILG